MDNNFVKKQVVSGSIWRFAERIIGQGVSFVVSIILARMLSTDDYGAVAAVFVFINIASVFLSSGLNVSLVQKKDADETDFNTVFWCNLALGTGLYLILFIAAPLIANSYRIPILVPVLRVLALTLPISAFQTIQTAYLSKKMQFKKFFFVTIIGTLISAVVGIWMAYHGFGVWALVAQTLTNSVIDTILLSFAVGWKPRFVFSKAAAKPLVQFGYKVTLTDTIATLINNLVSFLMGIKYTPTDLAFYTKGIHIPRLFRDNIMVTMIGVLFPAMSNLSEKENIRKLCRKGIGAIAYLVFPMMFGIIAVNRNMITVLYTDKWLGMEPYIVISCLEAVLSISPTISFQAVKSLGRSDILLRNELVTKPVYVLFVVAGMFISPLAMAVGMLVASVYCTAAAMLFARKTVGYSLREQLADISRPLLMSLAMCGITALTGLLSLPRIVLLILQIAVGAGTYLFLSIVTKDPNYALMRGLIRERLPGKRR